MAACVLRMFRVSFRVIEVVIVDVDGASYAAVNIYPKFRVSMDHCRRVVDVV